MKRNRYICAKVTTSLARVFVLKIVKDLVHLKDRNAVMCNNPLMADVWFNVGSDFLSSQVNAESGASSTMPQKIPAHK